jgi:hypothetical protein
MPRGRVPHPVLQRSVDPAAECHDHSGAVNTRPAAVARLRSARQLLLQSLASLDDLCRNAVLQLGQGADVMAAIATINRCIVPLLPLQAEAVVAAAGTVDLDAHGREMINTELE